jgi:hypothetical protein
MKYEDPYEFFANGAFAKCWIICHHGHSVKAFRFINKKPGCYALNPGLGKKTFTL